MIINIPSSALHHPLLSPFLFFAFVPPSTCHPYPDLSACQDPDDESQVPGKPGADAAACEAEHDDGLDAVEDVECDSGDESEDPPVAMEIPESPPHEPVADMPTSTLEPESGESGPLGTDVLDELMQEEDKNKALNDRMEKREKIIKEALNQNATIEKKKSFVETSSLVETKKNM